MCTNHLTGAPEYEILTWSLYERVMDRDEADDVPSLYRLNGCVVNYLVNEVMNDEAATVKGDFDVRYEEHGRRRVIRRVLNFGRKKQRIIQDIGRALVEISTAYSARELRENPRADLFLTPIYRCAYVYRYFASHAYMLRQFLLETYRAIPNFRCHLDVLIDKGDIRLCALGGGPGTDIVGFMLFLNAQFQLGLPEPAAPFGTYQKRYLDRQSSSAQVQSVSYETHVRIPFNVSNQYLPGHFRRRVVRRQIRVLASVLDSCPDWNRAADLIFQTYQSNTQRRVCLLNHLNYHHADFANPHFAAQYWPDVQNADLVTMVKTLSAVAGSGCRREMVLRSLKSIFNKMKPGALGFYLDNAGGEYTELVVRAAAECGMRPLYRAEHRDCKIPSREHVMFLEPYRTLLNQGPQSRARVSVIIMWKPYPAQPINLSILTHMLKNARIS